MSDLEKDLDDATEIRMLRTHKSALKEAVKSIAAERDALKAQLAVAKTAMEKAANANCPVYVSHPQSVWWREHFQEPIREALRRMDEGK